MATAVINKTAEFGTAGFLNLLTSLHNETIFEGEKNFNAPEAQAFLIKYSNSTYYAAAVYLIVIFGGRHLMKNRERFELRNPLVLWNLGLALFSTLGAVRVIPELIHVLFQRENGFYHSVCLAGFFDNKVLGYWNMLFVLSKWFELGDTIFIVLRKQPLIFLHWYHHMTVLIYAWSIGADSSSTSRWFSSFNYFIHSMMYTYYGMKALKIKMPKKLAVAITSTQILQMVVGIILLCSAWTYKSNGHVCEVSDNNIIAGLGIYGSYWILFANFFYNAYLVKNKATAEKEQSRLNKLD